VSRVSQLADPNRSHPQGTSVTQELTETIGWFFRETRLIESSLAGSFTPALRDGSRLHIVVTGAEAPAYFLSVPPGRTCRV